MEDPIKNDFSDEFLDDDGTTEDNALSFADPVSDEDDFFQESAEDFRTKTKKVEWKWILIGCGGGLLLTCICCFITLGILWFTGDSLADWLMTV